MMMKRLGDDGISSWDSGLVIPGLYVGSLRATTCHYLRKFHISHVLTAASRLQVDIPNDICHEQIDIADHPAENLFSHLARALEFLDSALLPISTSPVPSEATAPTPAVLVHCASGVSRSVSICCAWLMTRRDMSAAQALAQVRLQRPRADPNVGFKAQLSMLEEARGDVFLASQLYADRIGDENVVTIVRVQRETANEMHAAAEAMEEEIQQCSQEAPSQENVIIWRSKLEDLQSRLDELASQQAVLRDGPAAMIRRGAARKVTFLLEQLDQAV